MKSTLHIVAVTSTVFCFAAAGCGHMLAQNKKPAGYQLSEQERQDALEGGGDELLKDLEQVAASAPPTGWDTTSTAIECLKLYANAARMEKREGADKADPGSVLGAYENCSKTCAEDAQGPAARLSSKYGGRCGDKVTAMSKGVYLHNVRVALDMFRKSDDALAWYYNAPGVKTQIEESKKHLGAAGESALDEMVAEYDKLVLAHKKEIDRAKAFLQREDVVAMRKEGQLLDAEIEVLRRRYESDHLNTTDDLRKIAQARRDTVEERYRREAHKAGVLKGEQ
jgi:hypothetical protein